MTNTLTDYPFGSNLVARSFPSKREDTYRRVFPTLLQGSGRSHDQDGVSSSSGFRNRRSVCKYKCLQEVCIIIATLIFNVALCNQPLIDAEIGANGTIPELQLKGTRFTIMRKRLNQAEAIAACEKRHAKDRLAVLPDYNAAFELAQRLENLSTPYTPEYDQKDNLTEFGLDRRYWIGLVDYFEEGEWIWLKSNGLPLEYDFWLPTQPDHLKSGSTRKEHCVTMWNPNYYVEGEIHTFNDEYCLNEHYFICEKHAEPPPKGKGKGRSFSAQVNYDIEGDYGDGTLPFGVTAIEHSPIRDKNGKDVSHESDEDDFQNQETLNEEMENDDYRQQTNQHIFGAENQSSDTQSATEEHASPNDAKEFSQNENLQTSENSRSGQPEPEKGEDQAETLQQKRDAIKEDQGQDLMDDNENFVTTPRDNYGQSEEDFQDVTTTTTTTLPTIRLKMKPKPITRKMAKRLLKDFHRDE